MIRTPYCRRTRWALAGPGRLTLTMKNAIEEGSVLLSDVGHFLLSLDTVEAIGKNQRGCAVKPTVIVFPAEFSAEG